jgi:hypothetical protein
MDETQEVGLWLYEAKVWLALRATPDSWGYSSSTSQPRESRSFESAFPD